MVVSVAYEVPTTILLAVSDVVGKDRKKTKRTSVSRPSVYY